MFSRPISHHQADSGLVWCHIVLTAYGAWLPGDPRGFRTRHHRQHVEGDYRNPPPVGKYARLERRSHELLKQPPMTWPSPWREVIGMALMARLQQLGGFVLCLAVAGQHAHALAKLPHGQEKVWIGLAKKHASFEARHRA